MADPRVRARWKALGFLVALVLAVDAVAIAIYFVANIRRASPTVQLFFVIVWTVVTLAVVVRGMRALRRR